MNKDGFSLLELSIVLAIIGLIAGGIVAGSSMIRAAELRAITTEFSQFHTAVLTFRDKYLEYPGDIRNATTFWGVAHATAATCVTTASTGKETCDGNGDGRIATSTGSQEMYRFWQHLANAELINGSFTGVAGGGGANHSDIGVNIPESKLSGGGWTMLNLGTLSGNTFYFDAIYNNTFLFGTQHASAQAMRVLTTEEMWSLDTKMDDGKPGQGQIMPMTFYDCSDTTDEWDTTADYDLTNKDIDCVLLFRNVF